ncbi:1031_t:CDS:2, partial [Gigaspora margarita]
MFTGCATVYLGCTQREDRQWQRPENQPVKRKVQGKHLKRHPHPTYRKTQFPTKAREWIRTNIKYNLRNPEIYKRLCDEGHINSQVHTKEQVYYWVSVFSKETYIMDNTNQLLSSKAYLEQQEFIKKGYKIIYYLENDFIRALGFITPMLNRIDSTFKTNQERFELFVVNANHGGYGVPLAYLYILTLDDAGEISAISEAWSWIINIQLCCWHLEHAINRRLKDKKSKSVGYTKAKAIEAHQQFEFIDPNWIPNVTTGVLCPEDSVKEFLEIIKKHLNIHSLIPVAKNTFWSSATIYHNCVEEAYKFCYNKKFDKFWGYLWANWYNKKDWKLFARSAYPSAIPLARTTMITESHWRVLKYNYKYNYNRPRIFPAWWIGFKRDWDKASITEVRLDMDEVYHVDINDWVCSCSAYLRSRYLICKHLIAKINGTYFRPIFIETTRKHDHPLIVFGKDKVTTIDPINNPWYRHEMIMINNSNNEECSSTTHSKNVSVMVEHNVIEERRENLSKYKKLMEMPLTLYEREIDNHNFVNAFNNLMKPLVKEISECQDSLQAHRQQKTWQKSGKLAFWLR